MAWRDEQQKVQLQIQLLSENQKEAAQKIQQLEIEQAILKTKSMMMGGASGLTAAGVAEFVIYLAKHI